MKTQSIVILAFLFSISAAAQQTRYYSDPEEKFKEAKEYFQKEEYSLAYPLFKELRESVRETDKINNVTTVQEINYYTIACALKQNEGRAEEMAKNYIDLEKNNARVQQMNFQLESIITARKNFQRRLNDMSKPTLPISAIVKLPICSFTRGIHILYSNSLQKQNHYSTVSGR